MSYREEKNQNCIFWPEVRNLHVRGSCYRFSKSTSTCSTGKFGGRSRDGTLNYIKHVRNTDLEQKHLKLWWSKQREFMFWKSTETTDSPLFSCSFFPDERNIKHWSINHLKFKILQWVTHLFLYILKEKNSMFLRTYNNIRKSISKNI